MLDQIVKAMENLEQEKLKQIIDRALAEGIPASQIVNQGLRVGMERIGFNFEKGTYFLSELIIATEIMKNVMLNLEELMVKEEINSSASTIKILIGTVQDDLHDLGKNIVIAVLKSSGFEVNDLGVNVPAKKFIEEARLYKPDIVGMSALLTTTMKHMKDTIDQFKSLGWNDVKFLVGGAPVTKGFSESIGADGYAKDAAESVKEVIRLMKR